MGIVDIVIILLLLVGAYQGYTKGFLLEVVGILAFLLAILGGFKLLEMGIEVLKKSTEIDENYLPYVAFLGLFVLIVVLVYLIGKVMKKVLDMTVFGTFDNMVGALVGVFKWALGLSILMWLVHALKISIPEDVIKESYLYSFVQPVAPKVFDAVGNFIPVAKSFVASLTQQK